MSDLRTEGAANDDAIVFVVDDDASVRRSTERLVRPLGFGVQTFASAREFLESAGLEGRARASPRLGGQDLRLGARIPRERPRGKTRLPRPRRPDAGRVRARSAARAGTAARRDFHHLSYL